MYKLLAFALVAAVSCNDLIQGPEGGRKIYDENQEASPAIWKQTSEVTIKANDTEVISRIVVKDLRPAKDGEAKIIKGGQGQKNVTVELKSPTIFRGYGFHIEVYATEDNGQQIAYPIEKRNSEEPAYPEGVPMYTEHIPEMENDTSVNPTNSYENVTEFDQNTSESDKSVTWTTTEGKVKEQDKVEAPVTHDIKYRSTKEASVDKIVQYANENKTESKGKAVTQESPLNLHPRVASEDEEFKTDRPDAHEDSQEVEVVSTTEVVIESHKANPKAFGDISKELGEHVVFGIKRV